MPSRRSVLRGLGAAGLGATGLGVTGALSGCSDGTNGASPGTAAVTPATTPPTTTATSPSAPASAPAASVFRFATASDGHLGEPKTDSRRYLSEFVSALNRADAATPVDFAVINGDIGHGGVDLEREAKRGLDKLSMPYYVTQGNHDQVSAADWLSVWGTPGNWVQRFGDRSVIGANTSNRAGDYLCADTGWLKQALTREAGQRDVFVFMHITPNTWTKFGVACPAVRTLLAGFPNLRAVFNGHDHDQTGVKVDHGVHYIFDARYGGHWGTPYRAFRMAEVEGTRLTTWLVTTTGEQLPKTSITW